MPYLGMAGEFNPQNDRRSCPLSWDRHLGSPRATERASLPAQKQEEAFCTPEDSRGFQRVPGLSLCEHQAPPGAGLPLCVPGSVAQTREGASGWAGCQQQGAAPVK